MAGKKKRGLKLILLLLAMIVLIVACLWITSYKEKQAKQDSEESVGDSIASLEVDNINSIYFKNEDAEMTLLKDDQGVWKSADDANLPINQTNAEKMKNAFAVVTSYRTITEGTEDLAGFGLDSPVMHVVATVKDGTKTDIVIGDSVPSGSGYYATLNGGKEIYVISPAFYNSFTFKAYEMVTVETLPEIADSNITYFSIEHKDKPNFEVVCDENLVSDNSKFTKWIMKQPYPTEIPADATELSNLFSNYTKLTFLTCANYNATDLSIYGLDDPTAVITLKYHEEGSTDEKELVLSIGSMDADGNYYVKAKNSKAVHTLAADTVSKMMDVNAYSYAYHNINLFMLDDIDSVDIETNNRTVTLSVERTNQATVEESSTDTAEDSSDEDNMKYYINGSPIEKTKFKDLYTKIVSPTTEKEIPAEYFASSKSRTPYMTVTYHFSDGHTSTIQYLPYDINYYVVDTNGVEYFLTDVRAINEIAEAVMNFSK